MIKTKLIAMFMAALVMLYTSCSEKETPQPVVNTQRLDALKQELRSLLILLHGEEVENELLTSNNKALEDQIAALKAEITKLKAVYDQAVRYDVMVTDFQGAAIAGATVTLNQNGKITTTTANAQGIATFEDVRAGYLAAVVSATGFATANYTASLYSMDEAGANTRVPLLPKSGVIAEASMFTVTGYLYADLNVANDTLTGFRYGTGIQFTGSKAANALPKGPNAVYPHRSFDKVTKRVFATLYFDISQVPFSSYYSSAKGAIRKIAYEGVIYEATFSNNQYTLKLPVRPSYNGIEFDFKFTVEEFVADKTLIDLDKNGTWADNYFWNGFFYESLPVSAYPAPATYTQSRVFRLAGYQLGNSFSTTPADGDLNSLGTWSFGSSALGAVAGQTYALDFYYGDQGN